MKKFLSLLLSIAICISLLPCAAIAADLDASTIDETFIVDCGMTVEEALSRAYSNLSPKAKEIFETNISGNAALVEYHKNNVDSTYAETRSGINPMMRSSASIVEAGLINMNLPVQVQEALNLLSSGIMAALMDGPLVAGDIYALAVSLYTAVVLAAYWDEILTLWDDIVALFQRAYTSVSTPISDSMSIVKEDIADERDLPDNATVTIHQQSRTIEVEGRYYVCSKEITAFRPVQERFYPAMVAGILWVCPTYVSFKIARIIMRLNLDLSGVVTKYEGLAYNLCNSLGSPVLDTAPEHNPNYLNHYHYIKRGIRCNSHAWFVM